MVCRPRPARHLERTRRGRVPTILVQHRPGAKEDVDALLRGKSTEEDDAQAVRRRSAGPFNGSRKPGAFAASGGEGVGLHGYLAGGQAGLHELRFREVGEGDVARHLAAVGAEKTMDEEHRGGGERLRARATVATAADSPPRRAAEAVLADMALAEEVAVQAREAVVVESLHDGHALARGRPVDRRRDQRKRVVAVDDVRLLRSDDRPDLAVGSRIPDRAERESDAAAAVGDLAVVLLVADDLVPGLLEQTALRLEDAVLAAADAVAFVNDEHAERTPERGVGTGHAFALRPGGP